MILLAVCMLAPAIPAGAREPSFRQTIEELKAAIAAGNTKYLSQHVALEGIVRAKVKKYAAKAENKKSFITRTAGRLASFSEPAITKMASSFVLSQFGRTSAGFRKSYLSRLSLTRIGEQGQVGFAAGSFLGSPAVLSAVKTGDQWVIVGAESPVIDREFKVMLRILHIPLN